MHTNTICDRWCSVRKLAVSWTVVRVYSVVTESEDVDNQRKNGFSVRCGSFYVTGGRRQGPDGKGE